MDPQNDPSISTYNRRSIRRERIAERRARHSSSWVLGSLLILIGIFILIQNLTAFELQNWWALLILIPAIGAFANAWRAYHKDGYISGPARGALISGFILTMVAALFLLNLNWVILCPVLLILAGLAVLVNMLLPG